MHPAVNPLARDPEMLAAFQARVAAEDWDRARRVALLIGLHELEPQRLLERDEHWLERLARRFARPVGAAEVFGL